MTIAYYITHPQVVQDPAIPVPRWTLSALGRERLTAVRNRTWVRALTAIWSSAEQKAIDTAWLLSASEHCPIAIDDRMHENDRSATGYLPPAQFEATADRFFAEPTQSVSGWEQAIDAQRRIVLAVESALARCAARGTRGPIAFCGHGGVGTLLFCHLAGEPIRRLRDQPPGGGNVFAFDLVTRRPLFGWTALEAIAT